MLKDSALISHHLPLINQVFLFKTMSNQNKKKRNTFNFILHFQAQSIMSTPSQVCMHANANARMWAGLSDI